MAYAMVRLDRMHGTDNAGDIVSLRYSPSGTDTVIENGNVVLLGALDTSNREVYVAGTPARDSALAKIALVASPEIVADERYKSLSDFRNAAGAIARGFMLRSGDIFSVTAEAVTEISGTAPAVDQVVELQAGTKLKLTASLTSGSTQVGSVYAIEGDWIVVRVV
jgi:hypothetical protein